ncbi:unnamed protein product [Brassica napus]|uniref:(rape) hypothetical protein n=1 Tax=Brassica napus TaxID=3708 RepID=A0A816UGL5_BRANA|nr:unnamed protein product [Brassica napus]CAF2108822.1 unnamed protein product [Brassica napus]
MKTEDQEETCRYMNMFSNSRTPYHLVNWVISQGEVIRDVGRTAKLYACILHRVVCIA